MFVYDGYSFGWSGAVANIIPKEGEKVWGGIFEISKTDLKSLDDYEGYPYSYKKEKIIVKDFNGNEYKVWVYLRKPRKIGKPSDEYRDIVIEGAKDCSLPEDYIEKYLGA